MRLIFCITAVFLLKTFNAFAQPDDLGYEPPVGWMYVMNLDSIRVVDFHAHNDTIVLRGFDERGDGHEFSFYSINGGATWDTLPIAGPSAGAVRALGPYFYPNSNRTYRTYGKGGRGAYFEVSDDLSQTFTEVPFDEVTRYNLSASETHVFFHPLDANNGFWLGNYNFLFRTYDGGRTWKSQPLPPPSGDARELGYVIVLDARDPKIWNVKVDGGSHSDGPRYYQTHDDGKTFKRVNQWADYGGIGYAGEIRSWWKNHYYTAIGIISSGDKGDSVKIPWLKRMAPEKPEPDFDNGYYYSLDERNYHYLHYMPDTAVVNTKELTWTKPNNEITFQQSYMYRTFNDGETWESIWPTYLDIQRVFIDQGNNTLWVITNDSIPKQIFVNGPPYHNLYKQQFVTSVEDNGKIANFIHNITLSPNPTEHFTQISFKNSASGKVEVSLYDILGTKIRTIYSGIQEAGEQKLIWNIPAEIPSGTYFLKLESGGSTLSQKLVITR